MKSLLHDSTCATCENLIPRGRWFCPICGRSRFFKLKQWEVLAGTISLTGITIALICLASLFFVKVNSTIASSPALASPSEPTLDTVPTLYISLLPTETQIALLAATSNPTANSCPGAQPQRVEVKGRGYVCTQNDRLIVRAGPNRIEDEITRIEPNTYFRVLDGPICANNWSWWKIKTDDGIRGWVSEGGDNIDPYFICPQSLNSP